MKKHSINNHIGIFDNYFDKSYCNQLIKYFEMRQGYYQQRNDVRYKDESLVFNHEFELEANASFNLDPIEAPKLFEKFQSIFWKECYETYLEAHPYSREIPKLLVSSLKIQKTDPSGGYHVFHFESGGILTSKRMMFVIMYLNDINDGGETEFLYQKQRVEAKAGRVVIAPAAYTHPHRGNPPLKESKYILTTWVEFGDM